MPRHLNRAFEIPLNALPEDGLVRLRPWRDTDVPALTNACRDPEIQRWTMVPQGYTPEHARDFVIAAEERRVQGASVEVAVADVATDRVLGAVGLVRIMLEHKRGEIGYWTVPECRRRGVATRGVRLLSSWAFAILGLERLEAHPYLANVPSRRVAEDAGFSYEGVLRSFYETQYGLEDVVVLARLRNDYSDGAPTGDS